MVCAWEIGLETDSNVCIGALLSVLFLRGVGVVGHRKGPSDNESEKTAHDVENREPGAVRPFRLIHTPLVANDASIA